MTIHKFSKQTVIFFLTLAILLFPSVLIHAQADYELRIDAIDSLNFPNMVVDVSVLDERGFPVEGLTASNLSISEDGNIVTNVQIAPTKQHPIQVVIAMDLSNTTEFGKPPTPLQNSTEAASQFISSLSNEDQVAVVTFSDLVQTRQDLTTDKGAAQASLVGLNTGSYTSLNDAIVQAAQLLAGRSSRPVIILLTDGVDSGYSQYTLDQAIQMAKDQKVIIFPIGWSGANQNDLRKLAELTHGEMQYLRPNYPDKDTFQAAFDRILTILPQVRSQYELTYTSILPADGKDHQLTVKLDYLGQYAEQTRSFTTNQKEIFISVPTLTEGQVVGGKLTLAPSFNSPASLVQLDIFVDNQPLTSLVAEPFAYEWDTTNILPGEHELKFEAKDSVGNQGESSIRLTIQPPITLQITNPKGGETVRGNVTISAEVTGLSKISKVDFSVDDKLLSTSENPPYEAIWPSAGAKPGGHDIQVIASDVNGYSKEEQVRVNVEGQQATNGPPWGILLVAALGVGLILVFFGLRSRKRAQIYATPGGYDIEGPGLISGENAVLRELAGVNPGQEWALTPARDISVGRVGHGNDIALLGETASRQHASIRYQNGTYVLYNLRPENPIYVNDEPYDQQVTLKTGDVIKAGESVFQFEIQG